MQHDRRLPILNPIVAGVLLAVIVGLGLLGTSRITLVEDIAAMLPSQDNQLLQVARRWGLMKKVMIIIGPTKPSDPQLHQGIDAVVAAVKELEGVARVTGKTDSNKMAESAMVLASHGARLFSGKASSLPPKEIQRRLDDLKTRLASPESMMIGPYLLADPIGFGRGALQSLETTGQTMGTVGEKSHLLSADHRSGLVIVDIDFDPMNVTQAADFVVKLDRVLASTLSKVQGAKLNATPLGGVHFAAATASAMSDDLKWAFILTALLVIGIFFIFFRRLRLLPIALVPGGIGIAAAMGVMGIMKVELHALTIGFAATITGISVDYVIHLMHRAVSSHADTSKKRIEEALRAVSKPVILGCLTTVCSFAIVATSGFTAIRQLAIFSLISLPIALLSTLFIVPAFHKFLLSGHTVSKKKRFENLLTWICAPQKPRFVLAAALFVLIALLGLFAAKDVRLSGDPRDLGYVSPTIAERENLLKNIFPGLTHHVHLVASGKTEDAALEANDALYRKLLEQGYRADKIISISPILPAHKTQTASLKNAITVINRGCENSTAALFESSGFQPDYFENYKKSLQAGAPLTKSSFANTSLAPFISDAITTHDNQVHVLTRILIDDDTSIEQLAAIAKQIPGCQVISERLEARTALETLQNELVQMLAIWLIFALVLLSVTQRSIPFGLRAALPSILGVVASVALFALIKRPLTPVASAAVTLVMGLGIDYGIFMQSGDKSNRSGAAAAVLASAMTTIAAFGVLAISDIRAIRDMGLIILVGVSFALVTAVFLVPRLNAHKKDAT